MAACTKRAITGLTETVPRGSALSWDSSLVDVKRVKRLCQASSEASASSAARAARSSPATMTVQSDPKQRKRRTISTWVVMTAWW
jgi:hypothetical protein